MKFAQPSLLPSTAVAAVVTGFAFLFAFVGTLALAAPVAAQEAAASVAANGDVLRWGYVAAVASTAVSSLAAAYAVARVGVAAVGAMTEKPELFGRLVVLVGLAEGIAIYGLIISILLLNQLP